MTERTKTWYHAVPGDDKRRPRTEAWVLERLRDYATDLGLHPREVLSSIKQVGGETLPTGARLWYE